jgi:hypothetical protein
LNNPPFLLNSEFVSVLLQFIIDLGRFQMSDYLLLSKTRGAVSFTWSEFSGFGEETAMLLRRISFEGNTYASKTQINI